MTDDTLRAALTDAECDAIRGPLFRQFGDRPRQYEHELIRAGHAAGARGDARDAERAVWLRRHGDYAIVAIEHKGEWIDLIHEHVDGCFSHIIEPLGIQSKIDAAIAAKEPKP
jgi:hypothetical protein